MDGEKEKSEVLNRRKFITFSGAAVFSAFVSPFELSAKSGDYKLWKWSAEAKYYENDGSLVVCDLCPKECVIRPNKKGDCRTRVNVRGKLYTVAYGNPCAVNVDPIEKKPLFHFLPSSSAFSIATAGCNFRCLNCQNWSISQIAPEEARNFDLPPKAVVAAASRYKCQSIAYTYAEPVAFYEYVYDSSVLAKANGIKNVLVSNGYIKKKPLRALSEYLDAANIDLKSFDDDVYKKLNGGTLKPVLDSLTVLAEEGVWLEITNLVVPTWTDDLKTIKKMCRWLVKNGFDEFPLHFTRFYPLYKLAKLPRTPLSTLKKAREIAWEAGMKYVYIGNVAEEENLENTRCPKCGELLVKRNGYVVEKNEIKEGSCPRCGAKINGVWK